MRLEIVITIGKDHSFVTMHGEELILMGEPKEKLDNLLDMIKADLADTNNKIVGSIEYDSRRKIDSEGAKNTEQANQPDTRP